MNASSNRFQSQLEALEHRVLFAVALSPTVQADRTALQADVAQLRNDRLAGFGVLAQDRATVGQNRHLRVAPDPALVAKLSADKTALRDQAKQQRLDLASVLLADAVVVRTDLIQVRADRGNIAAVAADLTKLNNDRGKATNDLVAGRASALDSQTTARTTLIQDREAIQNSRGFSASTLTSALSTFATDRAHMEQTLASDLEKITADRAKLFSDVRLKV
jgi:hypothetical protein